VVNTVVSTSFAPALTPALSRSSDSIDCIDALAVDAGCLTSPENGGSLDSCVSTLAEGSGLACAAAAAICGP